MMRMNTVQWEEGLFDIGTTKMIRSVDATGSSLSIRMSVYSKIPRQFP